MVKFGLYTVVLVLSTLLVVASIFLPITVHSRTELSHVELGLPVGFVVQDQSRYSPPLPRQTRFYSPWENFTRVLWWRFLLDAAVVAGAISLTLYAVKIFFAKSAGRSNATEVTNSDSSLSQGRRKSLLVFLLTLDGFVLGGCVTLVLMRNLVLWFCCSSEPPRWEVYNLLDHLIPYYAVYGGALLILLLTTILVWGITRKPTSREEVR